MINPINIIESNFHNAYYTLVKQLIHGESSIIGDPKNQHEIVGLPGMITLKNNAIKQIELGEIHPDYPFKSIDQYADQFTYEWQDKNGVGGFEYTYFNRLSNYNQLNQLNNLFYNLQQQISHCMSSNRNHAITWIPEIDSDSDSLPCLQSINIKYVDNNQVDIFLYWRSRDAYTAWQSNIIAIIKMLNKYVIKPNKCTIRVITEFCNNYHIYKSSLFFAENMKLPSPQFGDRNKIGEY